MDFITENGLNLFGIEFIPPKKKAELDSSEIESFAEPSTEDGSDIVVSAGAHQIAYLDLTSETFSDIARIKKYRELAMIPEVDQAIEDIVAEAVVSDEELAPVRILFDDYDEKEKKTYMSEKLKKSIENEFEYLMELLHFNTHGHDIFRQWYIDGRIVYHEIINEKTQKEKGIIELRNFDPINIKKIKEVEEKIHPESGARMYVNKEEYFVYSERTESTSNKNLGFSRATKDGRQLRISKDAIAYCTSGLLDEQRKNVISFLHKAIKPANQLNMLENALVIYMLARAPERRVFYVDVGNLPTKKAEEYLNKTIAKFRNKISFDAKTGEIRDQRNAMAMVEDFWLPRSSISGRSGTEISTLSGGTSLASNSEYIDYFKKKLFRALNVPLNRLEQEAQFSLGRSSEITRDEVKFSKFISRLRRRFSDLFYQLLRTQLLLKNIVSVEEWDSIKQHIRFDFIRDNHFTELKEAEIIRERMATLRELDEYTGRYFSKQWVLKNVLRQSDSEIEEIQKEIEKEKEEEPEDDAMGDDNGGFPNSGFPSKRF